MYDYQPRNSRLNLVLHACTVAIVAVAFAATATVGILDKFAGTLT